jgi:hypothetical protein
LLALVGGGLGILAGTGALSIFKSLLPSSTPGLAQASIDWPIAAAVAGLALITGLAFGIAPALSASQIDLAQSIRTGSQRSTAAFWTRLRGGLIGAEVALTVVLVVSAGLLIKSLYTLSEVPPGFQPQQILTVRISPNSSFCTQRPACVALYDRLLEGARVSRVWRRRLLQARFPWMPNSPTWQWTWKAIPSQWTTPPLCSGLAPSAPAIFERYGFRCWPAGTSPKRTEPSRLPFS